MGNKTLRNLYYGKINPMAEKIKQDGEHGIKGCEVCNYEDELFALLDERQKAVFDKFLKADSDLNGISGEERFVQGFRLGAKLVIETLYEKTMS